ncbi:uncharacterized protein LOC134856738 [Symsagittifera roscoffensis]|uniref:uncharacterized protein LOC134856738 n=1 Tax=Symsagittifera roscoffensis TaxID=84072 RepID=UPI00307BB274
MFIAASPLVSNSTLNLFGVSLPFLLGAFIVQDNLSNEDYIGLSGFVHQWYVESSEPDLSIEVNSTYYRNYRGSGNLTKGHLVLFECPPKNTTLIRVQHFISDNIERNISTNENETIPTAFADDAVFLGPSRQNLTFNNSFTLVWTGASECQVEYTRNIQKELRTVVDDIRWVSDYDSWEGDILDFQTIADRINAEKDALRASVETNHSTDSLEYARHAQFLQQMDEIISNIASVNWEIQGLLQDNTTKTYHVIAVLNETYSWSETLLNDKSTDHNQLSKLIESECSSMVFYPKYRNPMSLSCQVKTFQKYSKVGVKLTLKARMLGERSEIQTFAANEHFPDILQKNSTVILRAEIEPPEVYFQNTNFMMWLPLISLFSFVSFIVTMTFGLSIFYKISQCTNSVVANGNAIRMSQLVMAAKARREKIEAIKRKRLSETHEMTVF